MPKTKYKKRKKPKSILGGAAGKLSKLTGKLFRGGKKKKKKKKQNKIKVGPEEPGANPSATEEESTSPYVAPNDDRVEAEKKA